MKTNPNRARVYRKWSQLMNRLNQTGRIKVRMATNNSAHVTRHRLVSEWKNVKGTVKGTLLTLELK